MQCERKAVECGTMSDPHAVATMIAPDSVLPTMWERTDGGERQEWARATDPGGQRTWARNEMLGEGRRDRGRGVEEGAVLCKLRDKYGPGRPATRAVRGPRAGPRERRDDESDHVRPTGLLRGWVSPWEHLPF